MTQPGATGRSALFGLSYAAHTQAALTIELFPIGDFSRGRRLHLNISSGEVNPNSGKPGSKADRPRVAENRIFADTQRPSHIVLPIIP
jgi:predicted acyl esterase